MTTQELWVNWCVDLACRRDGYFWSGARKITSHQKLTLPRIDSSITLESVGFTQYKLTRLKDLYIVLDQIEVAMMLHARNVARRKYASSAFSCFGHLLKATKTSKHGSMMGACMLAVTLTLHPHQNRTSVDVYYRTTEAFKKFPADLVLIRDCILPLIPGQDQFPVTSINFFFTSVTAHTMYFPAVLPYLPDPVATLTLIRDRDLTFHNHTITWLARYLIGGSASLAIQKFAQAKRTGESAQSIISANADHKRRLIQYLHRHKEDAIPKRTRFDREAILDSFDDALEGVL